MFTNIKEISSLFNSKLESFGTLFCCNVVLLLAPQNVSNHYAEKSLR